MTTTLVRAWMDDPGAPTTHDAGTLLTTRVSALATGAFPTDIDFDGTPPGADVYEPGSVGFRYWAAAAALRRASDFWGTRLPGVAWHATVGPTLRVILDDGQDLNAFYDRKNLKFFHAVVSGRTVYSGESPDIVCHELGHAVLDAIRPQLWNAASLEAAAFHESFGDMSAILCALTLPEMRRAVLNDTGGAIQRSSRLSRLAEQLGWAIRQEVPTAVDTDCLRNAVNRFFYRRPSDLPSNGPATSLSSEPHSFSRVFTGAFFEALASTFALSTGGDDASLLGASTWLADVLVQAVRAAPVVPSYYAQVAGHMIAIATTKSEDHGRAVRTAFVRHGVVSAQGAVTASQAGPEVGMVAGAPAALDEVELDASHLGLGTITIETASHPKSRGMGIAGAAPNRGDAPDASAEEDARDFLEDLIRRGRLDDARQAKGLVSLVHPTTKKTHLLEEKAGRVRLVRKRIDCGLQCSAHTHS